MTSRIGWGCWWVGFIVTAAHAADYSIQSISPTTIAPGQAISLEVLLNGIVAPDPLLRAYQVQLEIVPRAGTTGSLALAGPDPGASIFIDSARFDWVFAGVPSIFPGVNPNLLRIGATSLNDSVEIASPKYCGTYIFEASGDAEGVFDINFLIFFIDPQTQTQIQSTFLLDLNNQTIDFTTTQPGLTVTVVRGAPPNDLCADRSAAGDGVTPFTTTDATSSGPLLSAFCDEGNGASINQDVWFEHTASCTGVLTVGTCDDSNFDTRLAVYGDGAATCTCPTDNSSLLACADDSVGCGLGTSQTSLSVVQGGCYAIRVGGNGAAQGNGNLTISCAPDLCQNAQAVTVGSVIDGSTSNTSLNDSAPNCGTGFVDSPGVWYTVTGTGELMSATLQSSGGFDSRLSVFDGTCTSLQCLGDDDQNPGVAEVVSWCSQVGVPYLIFVHGVGGDSGDFTLGTDSQSCDDGNACTDDSCNASVCVHQDNFDGSTFCCAPSTGNLEMIDDGNPCTNDACNGVTGVVGHPAGPDGPNAGCDDGVPCTLDECSAGFCVNIDINTLSCLSDANCPTDSTCVNNLCRCVGPTLELIVVPGAAPVPGCFQSSEFITVRVEMGPQEAIFITGEGQDISVAQFFLEYDPSTLAFVSINPAGGTFTFQLSERVDTFAGTIDYAVSTGLGAGGTRLPTRVAVITFQALVECSGFVRFRPTGPNGQTNFLSTTTGEKIEPGLVDAIPIKINTFSPVLSACPADQMTGPDAGQTSATITWTNPTATDNCDGGATAVACNPPSGSSFSPGTTTVTCRSVDSCGLEDTCTFNVTVQPPVVMVDLELSATVSAGPFTRCIEFELFDCSGQQATVTQDIEFTNGFALGVPVDVPGGFWTCITASDPLHTLRSTATDFTTLDFIDYTASFVGPTATGGTWLTGGDLNADDSIDILDFALFSSKFLSQAVSNTPCGTPGPDANINGDNVVDLPDFAFIAANLFLISPPGCCGVAAAASNDPLTSISVRELRARGLGELVVADINGDGIVDLDDMTLLLSGVVPGDSAGVSGIKKLRSSGRRGVMKR